MATSPEVVTVVEAAAKLIGTLGFPIAVAVYLLINFPRHIDRLCQSQEQLQEKILVAVSGLRSDIHELARLLDYTDRLRRYGDDRWRNPGHPKADDHE